MFTSKGILLAIFICFPVAYIGNVLDNNGLLIFGWRIGETIATYAFIIGCAAVGLFLLSIFAGILPFMPGFGSDEREEDLIFTKNELIEADREDAPHHNESMRSNASAMWDGFTSPVYEDYDGILRNAHTNEAIHDNRTSKRRVKGGKVSSDYEQLPDGRYRFIRK